MVVQAEKQRLLAQRAKLRSLLSPMSPIRRLSNEVLLHIFEYVCEENLLQSYPWFSDRRPLIELISPVITYLPTMAISSVCSRWRVLALSSPSLWANIKVEMYTPAGEKATALVGFVDTVARFLERSGNWPLSLSLYMEGIPSYETGQPPLTFLTQHARRWKTFMYRGDCLLTKYVTLSNFHFPLLAELDIGTFDEREEILPDLDCFEHAPRLCTLGTSEVPTSKVPYHHLRRLKLWDSSHSSLVETLHRCPSVKSLGLVGWEDYDLESSTHYMSRNITSLTITRDYDSYLELVLLTFNLPSLNTIVLDSYDEAPKYWPTETFISFISRSSCMITTFTLRSISLSDLDLLAALQVMPSLLHLEIEDYQRVHPPAQYSPITSNLISRLIHHEYTSISKLHTLHLVSQYDNGTFDDSAFVNMVESRWFRPGSDRFAAMSMMGRSCIRSVVLKFDWREVDAEVYKPLRNLDNEGLRVVVAGTNGVQV